MNRKSVIGVLIAALTTVAVAGCGTSAPAATSTTGAGAPSASSSATVQHNDADIAFVQGMIPHHTQAVAMAQLVDGRASSPKVIELAKQIEQAQGPEITQMQGFLSSWNVAAAPTGSMGGMAGMGGMGGTSGMSGMMTDQQMQQLDSANGAAFDRMWLQMMTEHHNGAVEMAQTELRDGQNPEAKALAQKIIDAQQAEITTMKQLLTTV
ncbi:MULTISPECIES: DUF305 domain-containing protein [unclassified Pseudonocardia]|uniref:DUF305 domain-containing protein n=1 Tax=unclassified Pseudonocardia TaxID=2619320 RepID=UPI000964727E|nr:MULTISPECIES: DUF305 domain-containing protein [unclassified Pseudonocardia]MBN9098022.1 DUF305 domain-containing protein [Pseudonocardia sp.]OJY54422.1 MAG: hypothetical protein BGP03_23080 [Pseudonocardia sp. 73-21]